MTSARTALRLTLRWIVAPFGAASLLLLSDLPTPSFLVDVGALQQRLLHDDDGSWATATRGGASASWCAPPLLQANENQALAAAAAEPLVELSVDELPGVTQELPQDAVPADRWTRLSEALFLHARVVEARGGATGSDRGGPAPSSTRFLCRLDVDPSVGRGGAHLVLGLNNHHVGSYYWARSAGSGAAMEAPGVHLVEGSALAWKSDTPFDCNSNDGKRSEWVHFLRPGDQVQLQPHRPLSQLLSLLPHVYGVSTRGRPLGSEPVVVCRWTLVTTKRSGS